MILEHPLMISQSVSIKDAKSSNDISEFALDCLRVNDRIRIYNLIQSDIDTVSHNKFMFFTENHFYIPYGSIPHIHHEIAHLVEMKNPKRWTMDDLGMPYKKFSSSENLLSADGFFAAAAREQRARAIQLHMAYYSDENSTLMNLLHNEYAWGSWAKRFVPYKKFKSYQDIYNWTDHIREKTYLTWSLDRIQFECHARLGHIQNWMETKDKSKLNAA